MFCKTKDAWSPEMRVNTLTFQFEEKGTPERTFDLQIFLDSAFRFFRQIAKLYI